MTLKSAQKYYFGAQKRTKAVFLSRFFCGQTGKKDSKEPAEDLFIIFGSYTDYHVKIFEEINKEIDTFLKRGSDKKDATNDVLDLLSTITNSVQEEFEELVTDDSDKKRFVRALSKIFALLLNTKVDTAEKIRKINKIAIETTIKI